jgi:hypothetical protein
MCEGSLSWYMWEAVGILHNLTDMHRKASACIGLRMGMVPESYQCTHPLINSTRKDEPFVFGPEQIQAQEDLESALLESPALRAINYTSSAPVILAVNTSYIAIGFQLCHAVPMLLQSILLHYAQ